MNVMSRPATFQLEASRNEDHTAFAFLLTRLLARAGIATEVMEDGANAIVCWQDGIANHELMCSDVEVPGAGRWVILEWVHPGPENHAVDPVRDGGRRGAVAAFREPFDDAEIQSTLADIFPYL